MNPEEYWRRKAIRSGSTLYYRLLFLPDETRRALTALYMLRDEVRGVVAECPDPQVAKCKLAWWREEIAQVFSRTAQHPASRALAAADREGVLQEERLAEIVEGFLMDLDYDAYLTFTELSLYCHRTAGTVERLAADLAGSRNPAIERYAHDFGMATKFVEILRDVRPDASRGRIYVPLEELERFGVEPEDLRRPVTNEAVRGLFAYLAERVRDYHHRALEHLPERDRLSQFNGLISIEIHRRLLDEIARSGHRVLEERTRLTPLCKFWAGQRTARREEHRHRRIGCR